MIISIKEVSKYFDKCRAVEKISLDIYEGEIFGLLGLNAAGKTTLLRCLVNYFKPQEGIILFKNRPISEKDIHKDFGYLPEDFQPPLNLSAIEIANFLVRTLDAGMSAELCLEWVGLLKEKNKKVRAYSRGMIQRLGLALVLLKDPKVIVLDEPILGLDLVGQRQIFSLLKGLNLKGKTIILSTHIFPHIEKFCHRVGIIHKGSLRFVGKTEELLAKHKVLTLEEAFLKEVAGNEQNNREFPVT